MIIVRPFNPLTATITSNIAPDGLAEWGAATTYDLGDEVRFEMRRYESLINSNTGNVPSGAGDSWLDLGVTNEFRLFDRIVDSQTSNPDTIDISVDQPNLLNAVAGFNLVGNTMRVIVQTVNEGVVYDRTQSLQDNAEITNWSAYFFDPIISKSDLVFLDLPQYRGAAVRAIVDNTGSDAKAGEIVIGRQQELGITNFNTSVSIIDYSIKAPDQFGSLTVIKRRFAKRVSFDVSVPTRSSAGVQRALAALRATPIVYIGDATREETIVFGFYRDFSIILSNPALSEGAIEVEGLT